MVIFRFKHPVQLPDGSSVGAGRVLYFTSSDTMTRPVPPTFGDRCVLTLVIAAVAVMIGEPVTGKKFGSCPQCTTPVGNRATSLSCFRFDAEEIVERPK